MSEQLTYAVLALSRLHSDGASKLADQIGYQRASMSRAIGRRTLPVAVQEALAQFLYVDEAGFNPNEAVESWLLREQDDLEHLLASGIKIHPLLLLMPTKDAQVVHSRLKESNPQAILYVPFRGLEPPPPSGQHVLLAIATLGVTERFVLLRSQPQLLLGALHRLGVEFIDVAGLPPVLLKFVPQIRGGLPGYNSPANKVARVLASEIASLAKAPGPHKAIRTTGSRRPSSPGHLKVLELLSAWLDDLKNQALQVSRAKRPHTQTPLESTIANLYGLVPSMERDDLWRKTTGKGRVCVELVKAVGAAVTISKRRGMQADMSLIVRTHEQAGAQIFEVLYAGPRLDSGTYSFEQIRDSARGLSHHHILRTDEEKGPPVS